MIAGLIISGALGLFHPILGFAALVLTGCFMASIAAGWIVLAAFIAFVLIFTLVPHR
jgi:hypothetical protein